jgi:hypothetical protein
MSTVSRSRPPGSIPQSVNPEDQVKPSVLTVYFLPLSKRAATAARALSHDLLEYFAGGTNNG